MDVLSGLNEPQAQAVQHTEGPLLILAGAGSGKTKTLTHRVAYLVGQKGVLPTQILAVTFTNKAAGEIRQRVAHLLNKNPLDRNFMPFLGTFHGICVRILRQDAVAAGVSSRFVIFDERDSLAAIKQAMRAFQIDEKRYQPGLIRNLISSAKNELIGPSRYQAIAHGPVQKLVARVYPKYQQFLADAEALDFDDILFETVRLFQKQPEVLKKWQNQFRYILVDEYQDTNHAQYQLVGLLAKTSRNLCVVGDDWQSIYGWRGANFRNILDFERDYPEAKVIKLEQNYRSTNSILTAAQTIISQNQQRSDKKLWTDKAKGAPVQVWPVRTEVNEAELVVNMIKRTREAGRKLRDFVVLYRANSQSRSLEEAFIRAGLPYKVIGGIRFYERKEIKDILAFLSFIYQPANPVAFRRIINLPPRGLGEKSLSGFLDWQVESGHSLLNALKLINEAPGLTSRAKTALSNFYVLIMGLIKAAETYSVADLVELTAKRSGYINFLNDGTILAADRLENVQELISVAQGFKDLKLADFLEEVALVSDADAYEANAEAVTLMTLHAAKGLEFPIVFMVGMEEGVFPHSRSLLNQEELEEERRLCYVGMTRAQDQLHLIYAASRLLHGSTMHNPASRFIAELGDQAIVTGSEIDATQYEAAEGIALTEGEYVTHPTFGVGFVIGLSPGEAIINFEQAGMKRISLLSATLTKHEVL